MRVASSLPKSVEIVPVYDRSNLINAAIATLSPEAEQALAALERGQDPLQGLEATAAGLAAGGLLTATSHRDTAGIAWAATTVLGLAPSAVWVVLAVRARRLGVDDHHVAFAQPVAQAL